jgi:hypothetical protein
MLTAMIISACSNNSIQTELAYVACNDEYILNSYNLLKKKGADLQIEDTQEVLIANEQLLSRCALPVWNVIHALPNGIYTYYEDIARSSQENIQVFKLDPLSGTTIELFDLRELLKRIESELQVTLGEILVGSVQPLESNDLVLMSLTSAALDSYLGASWLLVLFTVHDDEISIEHIASGHGWKSCYLTNGRLVIQDVARPNELQVYCSASERIENAYRGSRIFKFDFACDYKVHTAGRVAGLGNNAVYVYNVKSQSVDTIVLGDSLKEVSVTKRNLVKDRKQGFVYYRMKDTHSGALTVQ